MFLKNYFSILSCSLLFEFGGRKKYIGSSNLKVLFSVLKSCQMTVLQEIELNCGVCNTETTMNDLQINDFLKQKRNYFHRVMHFNSFK